MSEIVTITVWLGHGPVYEASVDLSCNTPRFRALMVDALLKRVGQHVQSVAGAVPHAAADPATLSPEGRGEEAWSP